MQPTQNSPTPASVALRDAQMFSGPQERTLLLLVLGGEVSAAKLPEKVVS